MKSGLEAPPPETTISSSVIPSSPAIAVDVVLHRQRDRLEDRPVDVGARVPGVEAEHHALAERCVGGGEPVEHGHQAVAAGGHARCLVLDQLLARDAERRGPLGELRAEQVEEPAQRPHAAAHAVALVEVAVRDAAEVRPERRRRLRGSRGRAPSRRCRCRARRAPSCSSSEPRAERLDRLVVRGRRRREARPGCPSPRPPRR